MDATDKDTLKETIRITKAFADAIDMLDNMIMSGECSCSFPTDTAKGKLIGLKVARQIFSDAVRGME